MKKPIIITFSRGPYPTEGANANGQNDRLGSSHRSPVTGGSATRRGGRREVVHVPGPCNVLGCYVTVCSAVAMFEKKAENAGISPN